MSCHPHASARTGPLRGEVMELLKTINDVEKIEIENFFSLLHNNGMRGHAM